MKKLSPQTTRQVITCLEQRLSCRATATKTAVSIASISRLSTTVIESGIAPAELLKLTDAELYTVIYSSAPSRFPEPDWPEVHKQLGRRKVTLQMLYDKLKDVTSEPLYSYGSFCRNDSRWKLENGIRQVGGNVERHPGERMEIDFASDPISWVDGNGITHQSRLFVATLPYSCMLFMEAFVDESQSSWICGIVDALAYFGAAPQLLVMDNAKALVKSAGWQEGEIQHAIRSLCAYYGMEPIACRPKDKNRVEAAANDVERWVIAQMSLNGPILSPCIENLNEMLYERLNEINSRPFRGRGLLGNRRDRFVSEELAVMKPLPDLPFELGQWKRLIADKSHCIRLASYGGHRYSVPAADVGKKVVVQITRRQVNIFDSQTMQPIGIHELQNNTTGNKTHILPDHLTPAEKYYRRTLGDWCRIMIEHGLSETLSQEFTAYLRNRKGNFPSGLYAVPSTDYSEITRRT